MKPNFLNPDICKHSWREAKDGMISCETCGKVQVWNYIDSFMVPKCECGASKIGIKNYSAGHSDWCPVKE